MATVTTTARDQERYDYENLMRGLNEEIEWTMERARRLRELKATIKKNRHDYTTEGWAWVGQEIVDKLTHRSNIHPQTMVRAVALLAANAAVRWTEKQKKEKASS